MLLLPQVCDFESALRPNTAAGDLDGPLCGCRSMGYWSREDCQPMMEEPADAFTVANRWVYEARGRLLTRGLSHPNGGLVFTPFSTASISEESDEIEHVLEMARGSKMCRRRCFNDHMCAESGPTRIVLVSLDAVRNCAARIDSAPLVLAALGVCRGVVGVIVAYL